MDGRNCLAMDERGGPSVDEGDVVAANHSRSRRFGTVL